MSLKKTVSLVFVVVLSFVAASTVNAQESADDIMRRFSNNLPDNCQDAIKRFPENLRGGWERGYIAMTGTGSFSDDQILYVMLSALMANYTKTNIVLKGKGNEKVGDSNKTYSQFYAELKVGPLGIASMFRMLTALTGNSGGVNWDIWERDFMAFL